MSARARAVSLSVLLETTIVPGRHSCVREAKAECWGSCGSTWSGKYCSDLNRMLHVLDATGVGQAVFPSDSYGQERGCVANEIWAAMLRAPPRVMRMYVCVGMRGEVLGG